jgi:hypothetical protein
LLLSSLKTIMVTGADDVNDALAYMFFVLRHAHMAAAGLANGSSGSSSCDAVGTWTLLIARLLVITGEALQAVSEDHEPYFDIGTTADAVQWVMWHLPFLVDGYSTSSAAPAAASAQDQQSGSSSSSSKTAVRLELLQQQREKAQHTLTGLAVLQLDFADGFTAKDSYQTAQGLMCFGEALVTALPSKLCCNHSRCSSLARLSEAELVSGKACVCSRCASCRTACFLLVAADVRRFACCWPAGFHKTKIVALPPCFVLVVIAVEVIRHFRPAIKLYGFCCHVVCVLYASQCALHFPCILHYVPVATVLLQVQGSALLQQGVPGGSVATAQGGVQGTQV